MIDEKKLLEVLKATYENYDLRYAPIDAQNVATVIKDETIDIIEEQPKIGDWIPCSEKYPEWGTKPYLVCLKNGGIFMAICSYVGEFKEISSLGIRDFSEDNPVIAWKPLPEPYEVEENG